MKVQTFNDRATVVTMVGQMTFPSELWSVFPDKIANWMWDHPIVDASCGACTNGHEVINLKFSGKSVCSSDDTFNVETGKRIAESRAKLKLYLFMSKLLKMLCEYYSRLLTGYMTIPTITGSEALNTAMMKYNALAFKESRHLGKLLEEV